MSSTVVATSLGIGKELSWLDCSAHYERFFSEGIMFYKPSKVCSCGGDPMQQRLSDINKPRSRCNDLHDMILLFIW